MRSDLMGQPDFIDRDCGEEAKRAGWAEQAGGGMGVARGRDRRLYVKGLKFAHWFSVPPAAPVRINIKTTSAGYL